MAFKSLEEIIAEFNSSEPGGSAGWLGSSGPGCDSAGLVRPRSGPGEPGSGYGGGEPGGSDSWLGGSELSGSDSSEHCGPAGAEYAFGSLPGGPGFGSAGLARPRSGPGEPGYGGDGELGSSGDGVGGSAFGSLSGEPGYGSAGLFLSRSGSGEPGYSGSGELGGSDSGVGGSAFGSLPGEPGYGSAGLSRPRSGPGEPGYGGNVELGGSGDGVGGSAGWLGLSEYDGLLSGYYPDALADELGKLFDSDMDIGGAAAGVPLPIDAKVTVAKGGRTAGAKAPGSAANEEPAAAVADTGTDTVTDTAPGGRRRRRSAVSVLSSLLFYIVIIGAVVMAVVSTGSGADGPRDFFGYSYFTVLSSSMQDEIPKGSFVLTKRTAPEELEVGDNITFFRANNVTVTHQIVNIYENYDGKGTLGFETRGVSNPKPDPDIVPAGNIVGRVILTVPRMGAVLAALGQNLVYVAGILGLLLLLSFSLQVFFRIRSEERSERLKAAACAAD